jgi:translation initiation factor 1
LRRHFALAHDDVMARAGAPGRPSPGGGRGQERTVYSTESGRICPDCGWPQADCKCSRRTGHESVPAKLVAKIRLEKKGRGGKAVTVVFDLPRNDAFLKELSQELKRACGTGGSATEDTVELQGDVRDRVRELLLKKGYNVKG